VQLVPGEASKQCAGSDSQVSLWASRGQIDPELQDLSLELARVRPVAPPRVQAVQLRPTNRTRYPMGPVPTYWPLRLEPKWLRT
jgi:hypothetical protein